MLDRTCVLNAQQTDGCEDQSGAAGNAADKRRVTIAGALTLATLGVAGNFFALPLFFGANLIFGSIAVFVAIRLFGGIVGVLVAIPGALCTIALWGLPGPPGVFLAEAIFVAMTVRRLRYLVIADALFWILLGGILIGFGIGAFGVATELAVPTLLANGVLNASIASAIVMGLAAFAKRRPLAQAGDAAERVAGPVINWALIHAIMRPDFPAYRLGEMGNVPSLSTRVIGDYDQHHEVAFEASRDAMVVINTRGMVVEWSDRAERLFGYSSSLAVGVKIPDLIVHDRLREAYTAWLTQFISNSAINIVDGRRIEMPVSHADGTEFPAELSVSSHQENGEPLFVVYVRDLTGIGEARGLIQRKNAQLALQFQVALLMSRARTPIEAATYLLEPACAATGWQCGALWVADGNHLRFTSEWHTRDTDADAFITECRDARVQRGSGLLGRVWSTLATAWVEDLTQEVNDPQAGAAACAGLRSAVALPLLLQGRAWGVIELLSTAPKSRDQTLLSTLRSLGVQVSQTIERLEVQSQLRLARDEAVALSEAKGKYISTLSHEIRTPLNAVIGMTSVIKKLPLAPEVQNGILTIESAAEQLLSIVNNVLDIERNDAGAMDLNSVNFNVHDLVAQVMQIVGALPAARSLAVESSIEPEVPRLLFGDQGRINQIIINLMSNATKFTRHGSVKLKVSSQAEGPDQVRVCFAVKDTGIGIPPSMHERVFEPFAQLILEAGGTGLGLTISREFAKRMDGTVTLETNEGVGSTFTFCVPLQRGLPQPANEPQRVAALHALRILDTAPEPAFDELVAESAHVCEVPIAMVSLVDEDRRWFKASVGLKVSRTPRKHAFCAEAILTPGRPMVVNDVRADPGLWSDPLVIADPSIRFYAGVPLVDAMGHALGTLCVLDRKPRDLNPTQLAALQESAGKVTALLTAGSALSMRVLVAEDTPTSQLVLRLMLEQLGHSVRVVGDGAQAVRAFAEEPFDLVLLDIQMPLMDGLQTARELRRHARGRGNPPIVGLSAYATQQDSRNAIASGMTSYLAKPIRSSDLASLIAQLRVSSATPLVTSARQVLEVGDTVDEPVLRQLSADLGHEPMAAAIAQFESDAQAFLKQLRASAAANDDNSLRRTAHQMKGLFLQFGAVAAAQHAALLEQAPDVSRALAAQRLIDLGPGAIAAVRTVAAQMCAAEAMVLPRQ
jgi:PAS domain S-box-containing protein